MANMLLKPYYLGIDVGTGSVRAALVKKNGALVASSSADIKTWRSPSDHRIFEQSTENIWNCVCMVVRSCLRAAQTSLLSLPGEDVASKVGGIGFDATCSLAVTDWEGRPVVVTKGQEMGSVGERNVILWADHRAEKEARVINATKSVVLDYVGGTMSLEMELPKILWLKTHMPPTLFAQCQFFDLPDYLTYRATNDPARSCCSLTCKCSFIAATRGWDGQFFEKIGLVELVEKGYGQVGGGSHSGSAVGDNAGTIDADEGGANSLDKVLTAGMPVGNGLTKKAADELGLLEGIPVGSALIDAYAGWVGTIGTSIRVEANSEDEKEISEVDEHPNLKQKQPIQNQKLNQPSLDECKHRLAAVAGTSTCFIVQSPDGVFVDGIWGPYKDVVFPGWWMSEGGQSATGQLIDFVITTHYAYPSLLELARKERKSIHTVLQDLLEGLQIEQGLGSLTELTKNLHVYPDFHGNRSPIADPQMRGSIIGLDLDSSLFSLAKLYHATLTSIALQTRHIIETLNGKGHTIQRIYVSGGQARNKCLMQLVADVCGMEVVVPDVSVEYGSGSGGGSGCASDQKKNKKEGDGVSSVVLGAAMLGRFAAEIGVGTGIGVGEIEDGEDGEERKWDDEKKAGLLWDIMVDMAPLGKVIQPKSNNSNSGEKGREKNLLDAKYNVFRESIEVQKRWRKMMEVA